MLVIVMDNQLLSPEGICQNCLMATQQGQPRWQPGRLRCGRAIVAAPGRMREEYECQMGFRVANIE